MRKGIRGKIAGILAAVLLGTTIFPGNVFAEEAVSEDTAGSVSDVGENAGTDGMQLGGIQDDNGELSTQDSINMEENTDGFQQNEPKEDMGEEQKDSVVASQGLVNYVGVVSPYLQAPEEQQIVLSYGDGTENVSDVKMVCEKADGNIVELDLSVKENELYLFKHVFEEKDAGVYRLSSFSYVQDGVKTTIELSDIGIEALFGVNEDYTGDQGAVIEETGLTTEEFDASVVTVELDSVESVEAEIEEAIEETVQSVEVKEKSGRRDAKSKESGRTADADVSTPSARVNAEGNVVVVLDPGHGGSDPGASANGLVEKELNLKVAQACKKELEQYNGVTVYMTRESDVAVGLKERADKAKAWGADIFVSLHMNSASAGANGVEVYYPNQNYNSTVHEEGEKLAAQIQRQLVSLGLGDRNIKQDPSTVSGSYPDGSRVDGYQVIRYNKLNGIPGIIVEHAFLTNSSDASKLSDPDFVRRLGVADATGIANYFNLSKGVSVKVENKDDFAGVAQIKAKGLNNGSKLKVRSEINKQSKTYSVENGKDVWNFNIKNFNNARGTYSIEAFDSSGKSLYSTTFYVSMDTSSKISISSVNNKEIQYKLNLKFADMPSEVKAIQFATWSDAGGQDDIIWYQGSKGAAGEWNATADIRKHKTPGSYSVHVYATVNGSLKQIGTEKFEVTKPTASVSVSGYDENRGTFNVIVSNVKSVSGVSKVQVPVWCAANQSDIHWYDAIKQSDGSYKATVNVSNHKYAQGKYKIHTYVATVNGLLVYTGAAPEQDIKVPNMVVSVQDTNNKQTIYKVEVANAGQLGMVRNMQFATWSDAGGQDDLIWYQGTKDSLGRWSATVDIRKHKTPGIYNVHVYATASDGSLKQIGKTTFEVSKPTLSVKVDGYREKAGTFDVIISNVESVSGIGKVQVPVWCAADQSDIHWYDAQKQSNGSYKVTVDIANHNYSEGMYRIHTYVHTGNGMLVYTGEAPNQEVKLPDMEVSVRDTNNKETLYEVGVSNVNQLGIVRNVQFATWSDAGGQDDIIWYQGNKGTLGSWKTTVDIKKHRTPGLYKVHVYATLSNGSLRCIGTASFEVSKPTTSVEVGAYNERTGTFEVVVKNVKSKSGVNKVQVPVWCASDQSDIHWYDAKEQNDGSYKVTVNVSNHNYAEGAYHIHTYVSTKNNMLVYTGAAPDKNVTLLKMDVKANDIDGKETTYALEVTNTAQLGVVRNVQFATWSDAGGQDDIIWYLGNRNAADSWTAKVDIRKHKTSGIYRVHVYATLANGNLKCIGKTTFTVSEVPALEIKAQNYDEITGGFKVTIPKPESKSGVAKVQVPVWCASDQSDIKWYIAEKQKDGSYVADIEPRNHKYHSGEYIVHVYIEGQNGVLSYVGKTSQKVVASKGYTIMGDTTVTLEQMVAYFESSGKSYPTEVLRIGGASDIREFCKIYLEEAELEGVRAEVAFAQAMKETGWLQYGGIVKVTQYNFAGIGALDGNETGNCASFPDVRTGVKAHIQHLKAYGSTQPLVSDECVDPRFQLVKRGSATYVEWLGKQENPVKGVGWATARYYGYDIVAMVKVMKAI